MPAEYALNAEERVMTMTANDKPCRRARWELLVSLSLAVPLLSPIRAQAAPRAANLLVLGVVGQANYGTIKGRLVWGGDQIPPTKVLAALGKAEKDPDVCAKDQSILSHELEIDPKTKGVAFGFAYLFRPKGNNPDAVAALISKNPKVVMDQKNCDFVPHSVALHQDQVLVMKSSDSKSHNVHLTGFNNGVNQVVQANGALELKVVAERLPIGVQCDLHTWMHGRVMVFDHPFFAVTGSDGSFEIKGVPAGEQSFVVWQEKVGYVTPGAGGRVPVKVTAGEVTDVGEIKIDPAKVK
jgi:hypothetical protein